MCGIFGYKGPQIAAPILEHGLQRLEYRGYDSAGIVVMDTEWHYKSVKAVGKVSELSNKIEHYKNQSENLLKTANIGIAHTRWATHGKPSEANTHPHHDKDENFFVVHNGIIENYAKLKKELQSNGYEFYSETDTEVIPALLNIHWTGNLLETVEKVLPMLHGAYALAVCSTHCPNEMIAVKWWSPLILWINQEKKEYFLSSDMQALAWYATQVTILTDGDLVHIKNDSYVIKSEGKTRQKRLEDLDVEVLSASKWEYPTFMLKEIFEQAAIIQRTFKGRIDFDSGNLYSNSVEFLKDKHIQKVVFVACGTSYHAGLVGTYRIEEFVGIDCKAEISSEYMYKYKKIDPNTLYIFLSQSWETADSIEVLKYIKNKWGMTLWIVNVVGSTIANLTDCGYFLRAGTEIGVASTKAFTSQLSCILMLALYLGKKNILSYSYFQKILSGLKRIPNQIEQVFKNKDEIKKIAKELAQYKNLFYLGRSSQFPIAMEGSLKIKEISYIHSEAYPTWELKHGSLALVQDDFPCILIAPDDFLFEHNMSSLEEIQARSGKVCVISDREIEKADRHITIPSTNKVLTPFLTTIVTQLLAYYVAEELWRDIDKPRNLAKSVTVK